MFVRISNDCYLTQLIKIINKAGYKINEENTKLIVDDKLFIIDANGTCRTIKGDRVEPAICSLVRGKKATFEFINL